MTKIVAVAAAILLRPDGSFLLGQRATGTFYPGYWEFPGGKVEPGETPRAALIRELREELDIEVLDATPWIVREHVYPHAHVRLHFFRVTRWEGALRDHVHAALAWQVPDHPVVAPMLPANAPVLAALRLPAFYGITQAWKVGASAQLAALEAALVRGLRLVQLREAQLPDDSRTAFCRAAVAQCRHHGARVLVNGDAELARRVGADGLHLPAEHLMRTTVRPDFDLVAASCHTAPELAHAAGLGLDFAVLGPVHATASHPQAVGIGWPALTDMIAASPLPVYGLGGLSADDVPTALAAGAQGVAAIRAAWC